VVIARCPTDVNGITGYFLTKLDVLSCLDHVPVYVAYEVDGNRHDEIPITQTEFHHAVPGAVGPVGAGVPELAVGREQAVGGAGPVVLEVEAGAASLVS